MSGEAAIGRAVVTELQRQGYETYEEVSTGYGGDRADVVGRRGSLIVVVECKQTMSLRLLDQVVRWRGHANMVIAAVGRGRHGEAVRVLARDEGFGLWRVGCDGSIDEDVSPRLLRRSGQRVAKSLHEAQRSGEYASAGSRAGGYWTPFQQTVRALEDLVTTKGQSGIELRDALKQIDHHYATFRSAMSSVPALIQKGVIAGLRIEGRPLRLYSAERRTQ